MNKVHAPPRISRGRKLLFAAMVVALLLGSVEVGLRLARYRGVSMAELEAASGFPDCAYVQRRDRVLGDLFVEESDKRVQSNQLLLERGLHNTSFPADPAGELRIFALGGSTTFGIPYEEREQGFPQRLGLLLQRKYPAHRWRLINAGVAGMDARSFPDLVRLATRFGARGLVIYTGNNEMRGALQDACSDPYREGLQRWLNEVRLIQLLRSTWRRMANIQPRRLDLEAAVKKMDACHLRQVEKNRQDRRRLKGGRPWSPKWPARMDRFYIQVLETFERNLEKTVALARSGGIKVWLAIPPVNYAEPPRHAMPRPGLNPAKIERLQDALKAARATRTHGDDGAIRGHLSAALAADETHAEANYLLGMLEVRQGRPTEARRHLELAIDRDYLSERVTSHMVGVIRDLCARHPEITCVDLRGAFESAAAGGIPGKDLFVDFCHPRWEKGVPLVARTFADSIQPAQMKK